MFERRTSELRVSGRELSGVVMRYGTVGEGPAGIPEMFRAGAFGAPVPAVPLNLQHDSRSVIAEAGEYELTDSPEALSLKALLPEDSAAYRLVQRRALKGLSVEFHARRAGFEGATRVVESAELVGIGLVDSPAYGASLVEARQRGHRRISQRIPYGRALACACRRDVDCDSAEFGGPEDPGTLRRTIFRSIEPVIDKTPAQAARLVNAGTVSEILAVRGSYGQPVAALSAGTVRFRSERGGLGVDVDIDPATQAGAALLEDAQVSGSAFLIRPFLNQAESEFEIRDGTVHYSSAVIRALVIGSTDATEGWEPAKVGGRSRRARLWL